MLIHRTEFPLRFNDTDMVGHVNNAVYSTIFEAARTAFFVEHRLFGRGSGFSPVIVRVEIDYLREINWPGTVTIETAVHRIGAKSFHLRHRASVGDRLVSRATGVSAVIDTHARHAVPLHDAWKTVLERYLDADFV
jgi:acyl-CoA thioester hydrolase